MNAKRKFLSVALLMCGLSFVACNDDEEKKEGIDKSGEENGYGFVDLGLSVKWATCNIGANAPEAEGDYYAWGMTTVDETKYYGWKNYIYWKEGEGITKYTSQLKGKILEKADDVASVKMGGSWRMPTADDWRELKNPYNCRWEYEERNGVKGYKITSILNKNFIFLPAISSYEEGFHNNENVYGNYWSSSLAPENRNAFMIDFDIYGQIDADINNKNRCQGMQIRAVLP